MQVTTRPLLRPLYTLMKEQFLIVPIFFKKQIESIIAAKAPGYTFGFFYGEQRENYRIIKKIWPLANVTTLEHQIVITASDFEAARNLEKGNNLRLLGCFYTSVKGRAQKALLSRTGMDSFSFVELKETANHTCIWRSSISSKNHSRLIDQKVIL